MVKRTPSEFKPSLLEGHKMTEIDPADDPSFQHQEDVTNEDRFVRFSKQIAEEIITVQTRLIALEKRNDDPAVQHEIELLMRQVSTLEGRKSEYDREIAELQRRIRAYRQMRDRTGPQGKQLEVPAKPPVTQSTEKLIDTIRRKNTERALSSPAQLPLWPEPMRGVPNGILRSALFGAVKRGKRRYMEREPVAAVEGVDLIYTGPRLDQADLDVWEGALHLARLIPLGDRIEFTEKGFLKLIGRGGEGGENIGKSDREWLKKTLARLKANAVEVKQGPYAYGGSLVDEYFRDESTGRYVLILNPRMKVMFGRDGWTQIDWSIRQALRGYPLAQWLHGFYSTHAQPYPLKVETLHKLCGSETGAEAKTDAERHKAVTGWRDDSLIPALDALVDACNQAWQAFSWELNGDIVSVSRDPSKAQKKHLRAKAATKRLGK
jgi:hypothetical protein